MKFFSAILFFLSLSFFSFSQKRNETDSLTTLLEKSNDSERARIKLLLSDKLFSNDAALAKQYALDALAFYQKINNDTAQANALSKIATVCTYSAEYKPAIDYCLKALKIFESHNNLHAAGTVKNQLGVVYYYLANYPQAMKYYKEALPLTANDKKEQARSLNNIGLVYEKMQKYDSALACHQEALKIRQELKDSAGIAKSLNNIGNFYAVKEEHKKAIDFYMQSVRIKESLGDKMGMSNALQNIGREYDFMKEYNNALQYCYKGLDAAKAIGNKHLMKEAYIKLSDVYQDLNDWQKAFEYQQQYMFIKDTILNEESSKQIAEMQTKYETEKKDLQITAQDAELNRKQITIYASAGGIFLLILLSFFIFRSYRQKQKANVMLAEKNILIEEQKKIVEEKNKDITDSINYAQRIQKALFASDALMKKNLEEYFVLFKPKDIVSGDFYWVTEKDGRFYLAVCDSTGHGVPGAFMSLLNISFLNEAIADKNLAEPNEIFNHVRERLVETISAGNDEEASAKDGMDGILFCFDNAATKISYAAANNAPLLINHSLHILATDAMPVGYGEKKNSFSNWAVEPRTSNLELQTLYLYTDGFADQFGGPKGKKFKYKQLNELLARVSSKPMHEQKTILEKTFDEWKGNLEQVDDVLVVGIKV